VSTRDELEAASRTSWGTDVDAAMRRHPAGSDTPFEAGRWTTHDVRELHRVLTAEAQQHLPPNWQAWAEQPEPSALHKVAVWVLLDTAAVLVLLVVGRIVWQGISAVVGL